MIATKQVDISRMVPFDMRRDRHGLPTTHGCAASDVRVTASGIGVSVRLERTGARSHVWRRSMRVSRRRPRPGAAVFASMAVVAAALPVLAAGAIRNARQATAVPGSYIVVFDGFVVTAKVNGTAAA
jgi:hypothetical protein